MTRNVGRGNGSRVDPVVGGYRLDEPIGAGGTGTVWRARRGGAGGPVVALKRLRAGARPEEGRGLRQEASLLLQLDHPHVVRVFDVVADGDSVALAMQYCPGGSLADLLAERGRLSPGQAVAVVAPLADALASAHGRGIVHGDLKPANVLFTSDGEPLLCDFGVARLAGTSGPGAPGGTDGYAAPEVVGGDEPDPAADVYSLGVVGHEALTGCLPDDDPAGPTLAGRVDLPPALAVVIDRARASRPEDRVASAAELGRALRAAVDDTTIVLPGPSRARHRPPDPASSVPGHPDGWGPPLRLTRTFGPRPPAPPPARRRHRRGVLVVTLVAASLAAGGGAVAASVLDADPSVGPARLPCPTVPMPAAPRGATLVPGDPDGDGCDGWAVYDGQIMSVTLNPADLEPHRYRAGRHGDVLLLGDWDCDGTDTPALYRPGTGEVLMFDDWDVTGMGLPPSAVALGSVGGTPAVDTDGACAEVVVHPRHA